MADLAAKIAELGKLARRGHYDCDDSWYSCPKSYDGCSNTEYAKDVCNCGADVHNAKVAALLAEIAENSEEKS